jgi:hypothetical protein
MPSLIEQSNYRSQTDWTGIISQIGQAVTGVVGTLKNGNTGTTAPVVIPTQQASNNLPVNTILLLAFVGLVVWYIFKR